MSYINEALKRAQTERNGQYLTYGPLLACAESGRRCFKGKAVTITLAVLGLLAGGVIIWSLTGLVPTLQGRLFSQGEAAVVKAPILPGDVPKRDRSASTVASMNTNDDDKINRSKMTMTGTAGTEQIPDDVLPLYREAVQLQRRQQLDAAENIYLNILNRDRKNVRAMNNLAVIYLSQKKFGEAKGLFQKAMTEDEQYVEPFYNMACLYARLKDRQQSLHYLKKAIMLNGDIRKWVGEDKDFDGLRNNKEFKELVEERT